MLGFRSRDSWLNEFEEAKRASDETMELLHQRAQLLEGGGADVARLTGTVRRYVLSVVMGWGLQVDFLTNVM